MQYHSGGVTAAKGFQAAGIHCGVKKSSTDANGTDLGKKDLALILSDVECTAAAVYTKNQVKAAPLYVTRTHLTNGKAWGVVANSGNANACAPGGQDNAYLMAVAAGMATGHHPEDFAVASTGVIGQPLNITAIQQGVPLAAQKLSENGSDDAAAAIMTTDTVKKDVAVTFEVDGKTVTMGGIAKGSGMIHPNMGTMLCFLTTDCAIAAPVLQKALSAVVTKTFNRITVDGDTSTNDMCVVLANGMAGNKPVQPGSIAYTSFYEALTAVCETLAKSIAGDGEGAGRLISCTVKKAKNEDQAEQMAKSVVGSSLVKAAMFGADANWGRVLCAIGYSGAAFDPDAVEVQFTSPAGEIVVCRDGTGLDFDEEKAKTILSETEVNIIVTLSEGAGFATCWGCDLTYDYVRINGDYRS